jgi:hypothetical protein
LTREELDLADKIVGGWMEVLLSSAVKCGGSRHPGPSVGRLPLALPLADGISTICGAGQGFRVAEELMWVQSADKPKPDG